MSKDSSGSTINSVSPISNALINLIFIIFSLACIVPLFLVLGISFSSEQSVLLQGYKFIPDEFGVGGYDYILKQGAVIFKAYGVSLSVTIVGTLLSVIIIAMYAYAISRKDFKYRTQFTFLVFFTMVFNGGLVPWYIVYVKLVGVQNSYWAYIIPPLVNAWYVMIMRTFYQTNVPDSIIESAKIDGAGEFRTWLQIVVPLAKPGLATIALFQTLAYWNEWFIPLMFIDDAAKYSLQYLMYKTLNSIQYLSSNTNFSGAGDVLSKLPAETARMAMCILAIGPIVLAYPFFQKYFIKGLTVGAVKG